MSLQQYLPFTLNSWMGSLECLLSEPTTMLTCTRIAPLLTKLISALILTPAVDEIPNELKSCKIYVQLDHDQDSKSLPGGDQMIQGKWEVPPAHWVCNGMIPL